MQTCRACNRLFDAAPLEVVEMMFGTREGFYYTCCPDCKTVQIAEIPHDLGRFYRPDSYYSYQHRKANSIRKIVARARDGAYFSGSWIGGVMSAFRGSSIMRVLQAAGMRPNHRVLDVGCGAGNLLNRLSQIGFKDVLGVDPFVPQEMRTPSGVTVLKANLKDVVGTRDVVMFNHVLEHVPNPEVELRHAHRLLSKGGICIVRIPTTSSAVWEEYGPHWSQIDAPRHLSLPSRAGMAALAERSGYVLEDVIDDGWSFGYWGSELFRKNIPLHGKDGCPLDPVKHFGAKKIKEWASLAEAENKVSRGDQAAFVLRAVG